MERAIQKTLSVIFCCLLLCGTAAFCGVLGVQVRAAGSVSANDTGDSSVQWKYNTQTGQLTIYGTGAMQDLYSGTYPPWFSNRQGIRVVEIGNGVTNIGNYAFFGCSSLVRVTIPDSVASIGINSFAGCKALTDVTIPVGVTHIESTAFESCPNLASFTVADNNPAYSSDVSGVLYSKDKTALVRFPQGNPNTSYIIPNSVTEIGAYAFSVCKSLINVTIPDSVMQIGDYAFYVCDGLTDLTIPEGVASIGNNTFSSCSSLSEILIPDSVTHIGRYAFTYCTNLTSFTVGENNPAFSSDASGVLYNKDKTTLLRYPECNSGMSYLIPDSVTCIEEFAFFKCVRLSCIVFGSHVKNIGKSAFFGCTSLSRVTIGGSVTDIGSAAFYGCTSLADVYYNGSIEERKRLAIDTEDYNDCLLDAVWHYDHVHIFDSGVVVKPASLENEGVRKYVCTVCGIERVEPISALTLYDLPDTDLIQGNAADNQRTYGYRTTVTFTAGVPQCGRVQWYVNGEPAGEGETLTIENQTDSYTVVAVSTDADGVQSMDEEHVTIRNGFFDKVVWFFRYLFFPAATVVRQ